MYRRTKCHFVHYITQYKKKSRQKAAASIRTLQHGTKSGQLFWKTGAVFASSDCIEIHIHGKGGFDAIFCGKQAIDGDTAQVGPEIAEHLGLPQVTYALEAELTNDGLTILKECEDANQKIAVSLPCLVTFTKPRFDPRYPTIKRKLAANRAEIPVLGEDAFPDIDKTRIGLKGSPTHVKKSFVPPRKQGGVMIKEESNTASAQKLVAMLSEAHLI